MAKDNQMEAICSSSEYDQEAEIIVERRGTMINAVLPHSVVMLSIEQTKKMLATMEIPIPFDISNSEFFILQVKK